MDRWLCFLLVGLVVGCTSSRSLQHPPAQPIIDGPPLHAAQTDLSPTDMQIVRGQPYPLLDGTGRVLGFPDQLLLWNRRVNNHQISPRTEQMVAGYLAENNLPEVLVRVNQYAPLDEWRRLVRNKRIGAGWRYTVGAAEVLLYALIPGRLIGDDWYNPFTDTINLYSDVPAIALHEAAYAKDVHQRRLPGTYAAVQYLPLVGMWYRTNATCEVLDYFDEHDGTVADRQEADRILFPMYGGALGGQIGSFVPLPFMDLALNLTGTAVGHVVGQCRPAAK